MVGEGGRKLCYLQYSDNEGEGGGVLVWVIMFFAFSDNEGEGGGVLGIMFFAVFCW